MSRPRNHPNQYTTPKPSRKIITPEIRWQRLVKKRNQGRQRHSDKKCGRCRRIIKRAYLGGVYGWRHLNELSGNLFYKDSKCRGAVE